MDHLWASLPDELRQLVVVAYVSTATSYELALVAPWNHAVLFAVREERERRTTPWRGGPCSDFARDGPQKSECDVPNDREWDCYFEHDPSWSPAEIERQTLARACDSGDLEVVRQQIAKGVALDFFSGYSTPLYLAVQKGHATCVRALLVARASLLDAPWDDSNPGLYCEALREGRLDVVKVLTEFGMPRWGRSFANPETSDGGELWAAEYCGDLQDTVREFLVATRKFNPRAGDPKVYLPLQAMEQVEQIQLLAEGNDYEQSMAIQGLAFLAGCNRSYELPQFSYDFGYETVCDLLPLLRIAAQSNSLKETVLAGLHKLINDVEHNVAWRRLTQLEEELSQNQSNLAPERELLWAELKALLCDFPELWTNLVLPEEAEAGAEAEAEAGAATGALKENVGTARLTQLEDELSHDQPRGVGGFLKLSTKRPRAKPLAH